MKILISNENKNAHYYIRLGHARAFTACGHECILWDINSKSPYDAFDSFNPDIFWGQTYNLNDATIQCIEERPHMRVILRAPDRGELANEVSAKYPILTATKKEIDLVNQLRDRTGKPDFLHCHYIQESINKTHSGWIQDGFNVVSMLNGADLFDFYNGQHQEQYASDLCFVGGRWGYKSINLDPYITKLCEDPKYNIKIFGNQPWGIRQYCGFLPSSEIKNALSSAKICPNIHEPHSNAYGYDIVERPFKLLSNKCFVISDYVEDLVKLIPDGIIYTRTPEEFHNKINYYLENEEEKNSVMDNGHKIVMNNHTYFHRTANIFNKLGLIQHSNKVLEVYNEKFNNDNR